MAEDITFSAEEEIAAYRTMLLIRRFEEKAGQLYAMGSIAGLCPLSIGQEGSIVGLVMAARASDPVLSGHRSHGLLLARGLSPDGIMAELLGRTTGLARGRGGSVHMMSREHAVFGGTATPGAAAARALGVAFATRYRGERTVTLCFFGDAAANKGRVFESFKIAADWRLPIVFVIDNDTATPGPGIAIDAEPSPLAEAGRPFGIAGEQVDGIDVRRARAAGVRAIERTREGGGPVILEMLTYRYRGHGGVAARPGGSEKRHDDADPIAKARARIVDNGIASEAELKGLEKSVREIVTQAAANAKSAAKPDADALLDGASA